MYDLNMKEIKFPEGLMPLDIFVGSIAKERATETIEGRSGIVDYGTNYVDRSVELSMWINSSDTTDYRLLRNELYDFFDTGNAFYIEETRVPSRVLKVAVDESFIPDRLTIRNASVDVTCRTLDSVFWESKYTTLELHDSGYSAIAEKYGLVDNIDDEKVRYIFTQGRDLLNVSGNAHELGSLYFSNGQYADSADYMPTSGDISVFEGEYYELSLVDDSETINYVRVFQYDDNGSYLNNKVTFSPTSPATFTADGSRIRFLYYMKAGNAPDPSLVGRSIIPYLDRPEPSTAFSLWNAGNVTVEPESMYLNIFIASASSKGELVLRNETTEEEFKFLKTITNKHIQLDGMKVLDGTINAFRDSNRQFIRLAPGNNDFTLSGAAFSQIRFDFKYHYK